MLSMSSVALKLFSNRNSIRTDNHRWTISARPMTADQVTSTLFCGVFLTSFFIVFLFMDKGDDEMAPSPEDKTPPAQQQPNGSTVADVQAVEMDLEGKYWTLFSHLLFLSLCKISKSVFLLVLRNWSSKRKLGFLKLSAGHDRAAGGRHAGQTDRAAAIESGDFTFLERRKREKDHPAAAATAVQSPSTQQPRQSSPRSIEMPFYYPFILSTFGWTHLWNVFAPVFFLFLLMLSCVHNNVDVCGVVFRKEEL